MTMSTPSRSLREIDQAIAEQRSLENPSIPLGSPTTQLLDALGVTPSSTGVTITPQRAMALTPVFACVRVLANAVASLPLPVYERLDPVGKKEAPTHPMYSLLHDRPNPEMTSFTWRETLQHHLSLWGNIYAEKEFDGAGRVIALWPLLPDRTRAIRKDREKLYVTTVNNQEVALPSDRVLHIPGLGFDGLQGYSPIALARQSMGLAAATEEYGARFFGNGSRPGGVLQSDKKLSPEGKVTLRDSWERMHSGLSGAQRVAVLEDGLKWQAIGIPPEDAQFLETRKFQVIEIARFFGVPPHMIADLERGTFSNIEQQGIEFVTHTVRPLVIRWEHVLNWELFSATDRGRYYAKFLLSGLMRGDSAARGTYYKEMWNVGALSINDIREFEDMNPVDGGDQRFVPLNTVPLDQAADIARKQAAGTGKQPAGGAPTGNDVGDGTAPARMLELNGRIRRSFCAIMHDAAKRVAKREAAAAKRAAKKGKTQFLAWIDKFYGSDHPDFTERAYKPVLIGLAEALDESADAAGAYAQVLATRSSAESMAALRDISVGDLFTLEARVTKLVDGWEEDRAWAIAERESQATFPVSAGSPHRPIVNQTTVNIGETRIEMPKLGDHHINIEAQPAPNVTVEGGDTTLQLTVPPATEPGERSVKFSKNAKGELEAVITPVEKNNG
jgi:HK97 family phage portal protein